MKKYQNRSFARAVVLVALSFGITATQASAQSADSKVYSAQVRGGRLSCYCKPYNWEGVFDVGYSNVVSSHFRQGRTTDNSAGRVDASLRQ